VLEKPPAPKSEHHPGEIIAGNPFPAMKQESMETGSALKISRLDPRGQTWGIEPKKTSLKGETVCSYQAKRGKKRSLGWVKLLDVGQGSEKNWG